MHLSNHIFNFSAGYGIRIHTGISAQGILSPSPLPIWPIRHFVAPTIIEIVFTEWKSVVLTTRRKGLESIFVETPWFEQGLREPKSLVLPLHHASILIYLKAKPLEKSHQIKPLSSSSGTCFYIHSLIWGDLQSTSINISVLSYL